jgi:hypothetical protein
MKDSSIHPYEDIGGEEPAVERVLIVGPLHCHLPGGRAPRLPVTRFARTFVDLGSI